MVFLCVLFGLRGKPLHCNFNNFSVIAIGGPKKVGEIPAYQKAPIRAPSFSTLAGTNSRKGHGVSACHRENIMYVDVSQYDWLDKYIEDQRENAAIINGAALATEMFSENELEAHAERVSRMAGMVC